MESFNWFTFISEKSLVVYKLYMAVWPVSLI